MAGLLIECGVMRNIMIFAAFMAGLGTIMAQMADKMTATPALANTASVVEAVAPTGLRSISLPRPARGDYNATVTTANGTIKAARTRLAMVDIGGLVVRDVDALVLPDAALSVNLLGLSFLSKLKRYEYANGKMVLEQ